MAVVMAVSRRVSRDLLGFGAHLLQELERVDFRHDSAAALSGGAAALYI
jgi:hypothetical protein